MPQALEAYEADVATAILGVDTLWGGDVASPSGTGRFIADCYFSGKDYPEAYTHPLAAALRAAGGVSEADPERTALTAYLERFDLPGAIARLRTRALGFPELRRLFVEGLADSLQIMFELALEVAGIGPAVPYERCVLASCGKAPAWVDPAPLRAEILELLGAQGAGPRSGEDLLLAVDRWRAARLVDRAGLADASALIEALDEACQQHLLPHLPRRLRSVPRANVTFLPIEDAWFSGSMNYLGRARRPDGSPEYEASYEINAGLEISGPEFQALVAHEVVPGHVTTFALVQHLYFLGRVGFEGTVLTMNSRASTLYEGIANSAPLLAWGLRRPQDLPSPDLRIGMLLSRLQDIAKSNASYGTWAEGRGPDEVSREIRSSCLLSAERAQKLAGAWAQHPLLGRMYMPSYEVGTALVHDLLEREPPERLIPVLYGARGLVDCSTVHLALAQAGGAAPSGA